MKKNSKLILISILLLAAIVRFWRLGEIPPSPDWDEAALGYNAYSILKTGRDEYGTYLPMTLRSFDDYKPPLYAYASIPSVAVFGLNVWSVRLPSAILGVLAVLGTYILVKELFRDSDKSIELALVSALLLSISPWHIQFSRIAFEANVGVTINIWALVCFLRGLKQKNWFVGSAILFGLGLYAYHSERIFLPLLVLSLALIYKKELFANKRIILIAAFAGILTITPLSRVFLDKNTLTRLRGTSSLADQTMLLSRSVAKLEADMQSKNPWGIVFDNRRIVWAKTIVDGYLSHYSLRWLFLTGDNPRHHAPDMGLLYLWELPFLLLGIYSFAKAGSRKSSQLLFAWFIFAPLAASPTTELPHAIRSIVFLPTFQIFTAAGIIGALSSLKHHVSKRYTKNANNFMYLLVVCGLLFVIGNVILYLHMYFVHMNIEFSKYWQYGYKEAVEYSESHKDSYSKIVVSTKLEQPHMFFLFYLQYDPAKYIAEGGTASGGFAEYRNKFDKYEFREIDWEREVKDGTTLYIGAPEEIKENVLETIRFLDGSEAIRIAQ